MNVWAISDLHLSFGRPERRDRFAARWRDHADKLERGWRDAVGPGDLVLLPGDLSMARNHRELQPDLEWLGALPGTKVLAPGITTAGGTTPSPSADCCDVPWWRSAGTPQRSAA